MSNKDLNFIKEFNKITTSSICKEKKIDMSNIYKRGKNANKVKKEIDKKIIKLYNNYIEGGVEDDTTNSL